MSFEITGILHKVLPLESGTGSRGSWQKQVFVIKTTDQYPKELAFEVWGDKAESAGKLKAGKSIKVFFNVESREWNGKYNSSLKAWRWEVSKEDFPEEEMSQEKPIITPLDQDLPF
jgi:hypothetical protein